MASQITRLVLNSSRSISNQQKVVQSTLRCMSSGANPTIKAQQDHFLKDDGTPVFVKGGPVDQALYRGTMGACMLAVGLFVYNIACLATKK